MKDIYAYFTLTKLLDGCYKVLPTPKYVPRIQQKGGSNKHTQRKLEGGGGVGGG